MIGRKRGRPYPAVEGGREHSERHCGGSDALVRHLQNGSRSVRALHLNAFLVFSQSVDCNAFVLTEDF